MRRRLKLAIILPVLFCGVEGLLWYWSLHSKASIPYKIGSGTPASFISEGLDAPAYFVAILVAVPFAGRLPHWLFRLNVLLLVVGVWYSIGNWLDHRGDVDDPSKPTGPLSSSFFPALVPIFGIAALWLSSMRAEAAYMPDLIQAINIALLQTWAVFLIGIPAVGLVRHFLKQVRKGKGWSSDFPPRPYRPISNFRLLEMFVGVFAALVLLWLSHGRLVPK